MEAKDAAAGAVAEWSYACDVLDRVCLVGFSLCVGLLTTGLLLFGVGQAIPEETRH